MTANLELHPDMNDLVAAKEALKHTKEPDALRSNWESYGARLSRPYPKGMVVKDQSISRSEDDGGGEIRLRIYRPAAALRPAPCVIYLHGGGFLFGSLDTGDTNAWGIADETSGVVVSVDYRLAPEYRYPAALHDVFCVLNHLSQNAGEFGIDPSRIALWGDSAGANLSAAVGLFTRDHGGPVPAALVLVYGAFSNDCNSQSYINYANVPGHSTEDVRRAWATYLGERNVDAAPYAAPLKNANLANSPPAFIHYAEIDPLADDSGKYAERLLEAGVPTTLRCAKGMVHGFLRARFSGTTAAREFSLPCMFLRGIFAAS